MKRNDCVVVFRDEIERMKCVDIEGCFSGLCSHPLVLVKDGESFAAAEIPDGCREQIERQNPKDHSVWLLNKETKQYECVGGPQSDATSLMSDFFQSVIQKRLGELAILLQKLGVRSFTVNADEVESQESMRELEAKLKASAGYAAVQGKVNIELAKANALSFLRKVKQEISYSVAEHVDVSVDEMERLVRESGFENETIVKMVVQAKKNGDAAWKTLKLTQVIDADETRKVSEKISFALDVSAKLATCSGQVAMSGKIANEVMSHMVLGMKIVISNVLRKSV